MKRQAHTRTVELVEPLLHVVRGERIVLDADLAHICGVPTKRLNEQVKRNAERSPADFAFRLTNDEAVRLLRSRSQMATLDESDNLAQMATESRGNLKSQIASSSGARNRSPFATGSQKHRDPRFLPFAFTEHGAIMAANVLNSPQATQMSVFVVRAFVKMRSVFSDTKSLARKLAELEKELKSRLDLHETAIVEVLQRVMDLLDPPPQPEPKRRQIGFRATDDDQEI